MGQGPDTACSTADALDETASLGTGDCDWAVETVTGYFRVDRGYAHSRIPNYEGSSRYTVTPIHGGRVLRVDVQFREDGPIMHTREFRKIGAVLVDGGIGSCDPDQPPPSGCCGHRPE